MSCLHGNTGKSCTLLPQLSSNLYTAHLPAPRPPAAATCTLPSAFRPSLAPPPASCCANNPGGAQPSTPSAAIFFLSSCQAPLFPSPSHLYSSDQQQYIPPDVIHFWGRGPFSCPSLRPPFLAPCFLPFSPFLSTCASPGLLEASPAPCTIPPCKARASGANT